MLVRFVVSNFLSFDEEVEFNMLSGNFKNHSHHIHKTNKISLLKAAAIYGANGAGKSNLIKALEFLQETVERGRIQKSVTSKKFKLNETNKTKPVYFEIEFLKGNKLYAYGVSFQQNTVVEEWLCEAQVNGEDKIVFERKITEKGQISIEVATKYKKTEKQRLLIELMEENLLKQEELLLGKYEELKIQEITLIHQVIKEELIIIHPNSKFNNLVLALDSSPNLKSFANKLLKTFDTGVEELSIETISFDKFFGEDDNKHLKDDLIERLEDGNAHSISVNTNSLSVLITREKGSYIVKKVISQHHNNQGEKVIFDLLEESDGTQRLMDFLPVFMGVLQKDTSVIIDEIDQSLHPTLLKMLVQKIMGNENLQGQLIFTTHESNLLDLGIFRQDEIWFAEKDKQTSSTQLYSLSEYNPRYDLDIRKGYLKGRFGAIPFLAHLEDLKWQSYDTKEKRV